MNILYWNRVNNESSLNNVGMNVREISEEIYLAPDLMMRRRIAVRIKWMRGMGWVSITEKRGRGYTYTLTPSGMKFAETAGLTGW